MQYPSPLFETGCASERIADTVPTNERGSDNKIRELSSHGTKRGPENKFGELGSAKQSPDNKFEGLDFLELEEVRLEGLLAGMHCREGYFSVLVCR